MENQSVQIQRSEIKNIFIILSAVFLILAIVFSGYGIYKVYDNSLSSKIVGGDAYNFIIYATRGTALVCVGITSAVISLVFINFAKMFDNSK
jgi:hypothetical protein